MGMIFRNGIAFGGNSGEDDISAIEDAILVGDGNDWAKMNEGTLFANADDERTGKIFTKMSDLLFGSSEGTETLSNKLKIADHSDTTIQGESKVQIGEYHQDYSSAGVYLWGNLLKGPNVKLAGNAYIDMSQYLSPSDNPSVLIKGDAYIDIMSNPAACYGATKRYGSHLSKSADDIYNSRDFYSPWGELMGSSSAKHQVFPYLHFWGSPTVLMDGAPLVKMSGGSSLLMEGNSDVIIRGASGHTSSVYLEYGANIKMGSRTSKNTLLMIESDGGNGPDMNDQIYLTTDYRSDGMRGNAIDPTEFYKGNLNQYSDLLHSEALLTYSAPWFSKVDNLHINALDYMNGSALLVQGKSHVEIGDRGRVALRIAADANSDLEMDWTTLGTTSIKLGGEAESFLRLDATRGKGSQVVAKIGAHAGAQVCYAVEPHGKTSIKFSPSNVTKTGTVGTSSGPYYDWNSFNTGGIFHLNCTPNVTDILAQWEYNESIFEGIDTFFQVEDFVHGEMHAGSSLIMRGTEKVKNTRPVVGIGDDVTIITSTSYPDQSSIDQLTEDEFNSFIEKIEKQYSKLKVKYLEGGVISSTDFYENKYATTVVGINFTHNLINLSTWTDDYYSTNAQVITYVVIPQLQRLYPNAVISDVQVTSFERRRSGTRYWYGNITGSAKVVNANLKKNISNYYDDGDFSTLSEEDQNIFISAFATFTNVDFSNATFTQELRSDMLYSTVISQYSCLMPNTSSYDPYHTHLGGNWDKPIQSNRDRDELVNGPVIQVYDRANLFMGRQPRYGSYLATIIPNPVGNYDFTGTAYEDIYRRIEQLKSCVDYDTFVELSQPGTGYRIGKILGVEEASNGGILVRYEPWVIGWYDHVQANGTDPVFEMIDNAELRLGTRAYLEVSRDINPDSQTYGEICLTVGDTSDLTQRATISVNQIKQLLSLLN